MLLQIGFALLAAVCVSGEPTVALPISVLPPATPLNATWRPVVLMHGLFASAEAMSHAQAWIEADFPGIHTLNVEIGDGKDSSLLMDLNLQVEAFTKAVQADPLLANGFNLVAHSQGGLISRGFIERVNVPPVYNFITWSTPHQGVYGVPDFNALCPDTPCPWLNNIFDALLDGKGTEPWLQKFISFAAYWQDVMHYDAYLSNNIFLADINNQRPDKNATYAANLASLNTLALEWSFVDTIVVPNTSAWFEFFAVNETNKVIPLTQSDLYIQDWIGLKKLDDMGRLKLYKTDCPHQDYPREQCKYWYDQYTQPLLNNTLP